MKILTMGAMFGSEESLLQPLPDLDDVQLNDPNVAIHTSHRNKPKFLRHKKRLENKARAINAKNNKSWK